MRIAATGGFAIAVSGLGSLWCASRMKPALDRTWTVAALLIGLMSGGGVWRVAAAVPGWPGNRCELCGRVLGAKVYKAWDPVRMTNLLIGEHCAKSDVLCSICGLAANPKTLRKLDDGRILCARDARLAVLDSRLARRLFEEAKQAIRSYLAYWPPLPERDVTFRMVNKDEFIREYHNSPKLDDPDHMQGLTLTRSMAGTNFSHRIYVLSGMLRSEFLAVCAHEYTHAWFNEHQTKARAVHKDTVEGFCELMAYKLMEQNRSLLAQRIIRENDYTKGQFQALHAAEQKYQLFRVIDWLQHGVDSWLDARHLERLLVLRRPGARNPKPIPWNPSAPVPTPVPDHLVLKGISRSGTKRFALINDQTFAPQETARVRVGTNTMVVRCLEIRPDSVVIRVRGESVQRILRLGSKATRN